MTSSQHQRFDFRQGETVEAVRARAIDELSRYAIFEVVGGDVTSSYDRTTTTDGRTGGSLYSEAASSLKNIEAVDKNTVDSHARNVGQATSRAPVRYKKISEVVSGAPDHQSLDLSLDVTVCRPKAEGQAALEREKALRDRVPPRAMDPDKADWFDPLTGEPRLWYWMGANETYRFFDKDGYDPATGEKLRSADRQLSREWPTIVARRQKAAADLDLQQRRDAEFRMQSTAAAQRQAAMRAEQDAKVGQTCDVEAANPGDPHKPAGLTGRQWPDLKADAASAVADCDAAVRLHPEEARYLYNLARASNVDDPRRSFPIFKRLAGQRYPAAYDNYGWSLLDRRLGHDDLPGAVRAFEAGTAAGDPDAMVSLANLMVRGKVAPPSPDEPMRLYRRAAGLGSVEASAALAEAESDRKQMEAARAAQAENARRQAVQQQQAGQFVLGAVSAALRNAGRR